MASISFQQVKMNNKWIRHKSWLLMWEKRKYLDIQYTYNLFKMTLLYRDPIWKINCPTPLVIVYKHLCSCSQCPLLSIGEIVSYLGIMRTLNRVWNIRILFLQENPQPISQLEFKSLLYKITHCFSL